MVHEKAPGADTWEQDAGVSGKGVYAELGTAQGPSEGQDFTSENGKGEAGSHGVPITLAYLEPTTFCLNPTG